MPRDVNDWVSTLLAFVDALEKGEAAVDGLENKTLAEIQQASTEGWDTLSQKISDGLHEGHENDPELPDGHSER